jgi:poly(hydroxyalkanoate) granule-associated protein
VAKKLKLNAGPKSTSAESHAGGDLRKVIKDSAHEIWLAGLGAYSRAQEEGAKVFETLVKAGQDLQQRTHSTAETTVESVASRAAGTWNKLEQVFEDRVARSLSRLGVPSKNDLKELSDKITALNKSVQFLLDQQKPVAKKRTSTSNAVKSSLNNTTEDERKIAKPSKRATKPEAK